MSNIKWIENTSLGQNYNNGNNSKTLLFLQPPTPWTSSAKIQAEFLLYKQITVIKHTFFETAHTILCIWHNFHEEYLLFLRCMLAPYMSKCLSHSFTISNQSFSMKAFFCLEMESAWLKSIHAYTPFPGYGRSMWTQSSWCYSWLNSPC